VELSIVCSLSDCLDICQSVIKGKHKAMYILFTDGRQISVTFFEEIAKEKSRVSVKKTTITLHMKKKVPNIWPQLEVCEVKTKLATQSFV